MNSKDRLRKSIYLCLLAGSAVFYSMQPVWANAVISNSLLPSLGGNKLPAGVNIGTDQAKNIMTITQNGASAFIKWNDFSIGANAAVNFNKNGGGAFNTLNYVNGGNISQIYGTINAQNGNIYIVNPSGVQIGNSAQINVGSLYVSNKKLGDADFNDFKNGKLDIFTSKTTGNAELMSLGNISANKVTFDGKRVVIDTDRLHTADNKGQMAAGNISVTSSDGDVVLGYTAYTAGSTTYAGKNDGTVLAKVNGKDMTKKDGYMWIGNLSQLKAVSTNLGGNYALRNGIDATATKENGQSFTPIGSSAEAFTGNFDGLDHDIFDLTIKNTGSNIGLFGYVDGSKSGSKIRNLTMTGGSITGGNYTGAVVGSMNGGELSNIRTSADVTGNDYAGGIAGKVTGVTMSNLINTGAVKGQNNIGGIAGQMDNSKLTGTSYNLGDVNADGYNAGGIAGSAVNGSVIGGDSSNIYNHLDVEGKYNVGGIVGSLEGSSVMNAENLGKVYASGYDENGKYSYHSCHHDGSGDGTEHTPEVVVYEANAGGIAGVSNGSTIENVQNTADITVSKTETDDDAYYNAGNVGGIVGKAVNTDITSAVNKENEIRGAHNVGGVAGYFGGTGHTIANAENNGGDVMATGARNGNGWATEHVRSGDTGGEEFHIGNIGGIAGYVHGDDLHIKDSVNRGTVHSQDAGTDPGNVAGSSKAANVGGVAGKIDMKNPADIKSVKDKIKTANISNSYNTGDVYGYSGVGGVAGMMYNGSVARANNQGYIRSSRNVDYNTLDASNIGGIVGDTTENTQSWSVIYDVSNKGQIGDSEYNYYGRHIGGIVGRLTGEVDKAYNNGAIYNGFNVVGGIAGWLSKGKISNAFNTGNITVVNNNIGNTSQVGGIAGAVGITNGSVVIENVYNLGSLRSYKNNNTYKENNNGAYSGLPGYNSLGGIVGEVTSYDKAKNPEYNLQIKNAYTTGNLYGAVINPKHNEKYKSEIEEDKENVSSIYGYGNKKHDYHLQVSTENTYYIQPETSESKPKGYFSKVEGYYTDNHDNQYPLDNSDKSIEFNEVNKDSFSYEKDDQTYSLSFVTQEKGDVKEEIGDWRIYDGLPMLNVFLPNSEKYFAEKENFDENFISSVQYGTAYDPLLTIVNVKKDVSFDWTKLGITAQAGLAVYGGGVTLNSFQANDNTGLFSGLIYSDGALNIKSKSDLLFGSGSRLYGSSVSIDTDGDLRINGKVQATGNDKNDKNNGSISLQAGSVDVYGTLNSAKKGETLTVPGINSSTVQGINPSNGIIGDVDTDYRPDYSSPMIDVADRWGKTTDESNVSGSITIDTALKNDSGGVNLYYGQAQTGMTDTAQDLTIYANGDVYIDSDLDVGGRMSVSSPGEIVVDLTNIGKVKPDSDKDEIGSKHAFLEKLNNKLTLNSAAGDVKLTTNMWDAGQQAFDMDKYDISTTSTWQAALAGLNVTVNGSSTTADKLSYLFINSAEELKAVQSYANNHKDSKILSCNIALKGDINANDLTGYESIGGSKGFSGTFDGRDHRIIGLETGLETDNTQANAGIFSIVNQGGSVKNLRIYSSSFKGTDNAGAVAGINNGTIENITTFGTTVEALGSTDSTELTKIWGVTTSDKIKVGAAGGIAGVNNGTVSQAVSEGTVIAGEGSGAESTAGGIAGINKTGAIIKDSSSISAVTASAASTYGLGGVTGVNMGSLDNVDSLGVTRGIYMAGDNNILSDYIGGIAGVNDGGSVANAYNESNISGQSYVGGIAGISNSKLQNVANAGDINNQLIGSSGKTIFAYIGGIAGKNMDGEASVIDNGRNSGKITGSNYVGGMVGYNGQYSSLKNLTNDYSSSIEGEDYVGGIAGSNKGVISADDSGLVNLGSITGQNYVGGVAGENQGTIENVNNAVKLNVKNSNNAAKYFGGVAGINESNGVITNATNKADVNAKGADYVGGITGHNKGWLQDMAGNYGSVTGKSFVGGIAGLNGEIGTSNSNLTNITAVNEGTVTASAGGAGGIFAENYGNVTGSDISNSGTVTGYGNGGTGGIFGVNHGNVSTSSLRNTIGGNVSGGSNVGGLIGINFGINYGAITGGRDANDGYYKYQIYNNGNIKATGDNAGGLFGFNSGEITAAYNTGAVDAAGSNAGGVAGYNTGVLDQVFSTIMTADGKNQKVKAKSRAGGVVGYNANFISNAYSTSEATADDGTDGYVAGENTGTIAKVYGRGAAAGSGTGTVTSAYDISSAGDWTQSSSYQGFGDSEWRYYNGFATPLLRIFLTKVYSFTNVPSLSYNGQYQFIDIGSLGINAADRLKAYNNNHSLIQSAAHKYPGAYSDWLYSMQIAASGTGADFNPNNLGYDIELSAGGAPSHWDIIPNPAVDNEARRYADHAVGRKIEFRERKAEINFQKGGMEL